MAGAMCGITRRTSVDRSKPLTGQATLALPRLPTTDYLDAEHPGAQLSFAKR